MIGLALTMAVAAPQAGTQARRAFDCTIGARRVTIVADSLGVRYTFGRAGRPEIDLTRSADSGEVGYGETLFPHAEHRHLRVSRGAYSYVAFSRFRTPDYRRKGAEDRQGLLVLRNGRVIARFACDGGPGFGDYDLDWLPRDSADLAELAG